MKRNSVFTIVLMMTMALWMTMGFAPAAADTCEEGTKHEVPETGSGTFDVMYEGEKIGTITWDNDAEPETVSWTVEEGFSLDVCVKGANEGGGLAFGSGQTGTVSPPLNTGGNTPDVSHFTYTVNIVPEVTETESEPAVTETETEGDVKGTFGEDDSDKADEEVAVLDDTVEAPQVVQVPVGGAATGGGSTSGFEHLGLFAIGLALIAAAGPVLVVARRASRRS